MTKPSPLKTLAYLTIDPRALGLFRIALACLLILEWTDRWIFRGNFISAFGLTPASLAIPSAGRYPLAELFSFTKDSRLVDLYLLLGFASYFLLLLGYLSRIACIFSLLFHCSLLIANPA